MLLILALLFRQGDSDQVLEKNLIPLCLFLSLPLIDTSNERKPFRGRILLFSAPIFIGTVQCFSAQQWALNRHKQLHELISFVQKNCASGKLAITGKPEQLDIRLHAAWALPYETLMGSRVFNTGKPEVSVKLMRLEQPDSSYREAIFSGAVFTPAIPVGILNKRGYRLSPEPYCILDAQQCRW